MEFFLLRWKQHSNPWISITIINWIYASSINAFQISTTIHAIEHVMNNGTEVEYLWRFCHWNSIPYWQMRLNLSFSFMVESDSSTCILHSCSYVLALLRSFQFLNHFLALNLYSSHFPEFVSLLPFLYLPPPLSIGFYPGLHLFLSRSFFFSLTQPLSFFLQRRYASDRCTLTILIQIN